MLPAIVPGLGIGVSVDAKVGVIVGVMLTVGVKVGGTATVTEMLGCSGIGEANEVYSADWVKAARVNATFVATLSEIVLPGVSPFCRLHALIQEINIMDINIEIFFFIGKTAPNLVN